MFVLVGYGCVGGFKCMGCLVWLVFLSGYLPLSFLLVAFDLLLVCCLVGGFTRRIVLRGFFVGMVFVSYVACLLRGWD